MSVPDDTVTPTPDEVPDPVTATAPHAPPAPEDAVGDDQEDASGAADRKGELPGVPARPFNGEI
ncbi:hypothetical protein [Cellulomonas xiejunii]|uniref:Uncharacterized protein n=1 Tax=Cellulomonas xiejunii TaxID=2968083 RepID=A0ABY5KLU7_9CELL|nr:hypothetical protein [Cellulomonas xiejunii]MCC2314220.1 hypothetical protein [Cellulomonas xiejunii]MCC2319582.1 hypothetical protein [Cellulomonas xiejunii]UUI71472.1 hypothetical protein NP048_17030 [Cellulomonas xiejunii]